MSEKQIIPNPFALYYSFEDDKPEDIKRNKAATREFKKLWVEFCQDWRKLQQKHRQLGAGDTAARDAQALWIKKHAYDIH